MATKMFVMNTDDEALDAQRALGSDWYVTTYNRGRVGQRVDTIIFCAPMFTADEKERQEIRNKRAIILQALRPDGSYVILR